MNTHHDKAKIVLTFDDGQENVYTTAFPIMQARGFVGTAAINSAYVGTAGRMSVAQLLELQTAGWAIANHTANHLYLDEQTNEVILSEYTECRDFLNNNGLSRTSEYLFTPYSRYDENVVSIVRGAGCKYMANGSIRQNGVAVGDRYYDSRSGLDGHQPSSLITRVDNAVAKKLYVNFLFHNVRDSPQDGYSHTIENFTIMMDYLKTQSDLSLLEVVDIKNYIDTYAVNSRLIIKTS